MANMYRYLLKYVGKYQVLAEFDRGTWDFPRDEEGNIDESFEDIYIPCPKGQIRHTYRDEVLAFYAPSFRKVKGMIEKIKAELPEVEIDVDDLGEECIIEFLDSDLPKLEKYFRPKKLKQKRSPFDKRNIPPKPVELEEPVKKKTRKPRKKKEIVDASSN